MMHRATQFWRSFRRDEQATLLLCTLALAFLAGFKRQQPAPVMPPLFEDVPAARQTKTVTVHVAGAVKRPGVYQLPVGRRVQDAIFVAKGANEKAAPHSINLAAKLRDGEKIEVPAAGARQASTPVAQPGTPVMSTPSVVNLNIATAEQLDTLPGVGPAIAARIIEHRRQNGAFRSLEDLEAVPGIGPKKLEKLKDKVTF